VIFECDACKEKYEEHDEDHSTLGQKGCKMWCYRCSRYYKQTGKIYQPERSKREESAVVDKVLKKYENLFKNLSQR